ncbi:hypothetical protein Droror1_Dr00006096 [Drosera rotundifolia]
MEPVAPKQNDNNGRGGDVLEEVIGGSEGEGWVDEEEKRRVRVMRGIVVKQEPSAKRQYDTGKAAKIVQKESCLISPAEPFTQSFTSAIWEYNLLGRFKFNCRFI